MIKRFAVTASAAVLGVLMPLSATAASAAPAARHAVLIRVEGTKMCVTAEQSVAGAPVGVRKCGKAAGQLWVIRGPRVSLKGTHLALSIRTGSWVAVIRPAGKSLDRWHLDGSLLRDRHLSRKFGAEEVLTWETRRRLSIAQKFTAPVKPGIQRFRKVS